MFRKQFHNIQIMLVCIAEKYLGKPLVQVAEGFQVRFVDRGNEVDIG